MSLPLPLTVRLATAAASLHITSQVRDLTFRSVIPGGFASCTVSLDRPLAVQPAEIALYGKLYVYAGLDTVWEGRLEDPGRTASQDGQVWDLTAVGPSAHAQDRTVPLVYVDSQLDRWVQTDLVPQGGQARTNEAGDGRDVITVQFPQGISIPASGRVAMGYPLLVDAGQKLARVAYSHRSGQAGSFNVQLLVRTAGALSSSSTVRDDAMSTTESSVVADVYGTDWVDSRNWAEVRLFRTNAVTVTDDLSWTAFFGLILLGVRLNADGSEKTSGYTTSYVLASEVVADLLGRLLTQYDGAAALITTTSQHIDQLAYPDGVTPAKVLDDLMALEAGYYWAAWESTPNAKARFEWVPWPATVRYEADAADGFDSPGSAADLYNAVTVRYRDVRGKISSVRRTQSVPELTAASLTRDGYLDLGDEIASLTNAQRAGDQFLTEHRYPPNAGRLTIARPIMDLNKGRMVWPWEVRPGHLIRVRGVLPRVDALNATSRDGVTVFKVVSVEFHAASASADLELDSNILSLPRVLATAAKGIVNRRR